MVVAGTNFLEIHNNGTKFPGRLSSHAISRLHRGKPGPKWSTGKTLDSANQCTFANFKVMFLGVADCPDSRSFNRYSKIDLMQPGRRGAERSTFPLSSVQEQSTYDERQNFAHELCAYVSPEMCT